MSNINQTSQDLKKKLSLDDYKKDLQQEVRTLSSQQSTLAQKLFNELPADQQGAMPALQQTSLSANHLDGKTVSNQNSMPVKPQDGISVSSAKGQKAKKGSLQQNITKVKVTYYLSEEDYKKLTEVYIKRLQSNIKVDRSSLIAEAIQLLYKREHKQ